MKESVLCGSCVMYWDQRDEHLFSRDEFLETGNNLFFLSSLQLKMLYLSAVTGIWSGMRNLFTLLNDWFYEEIDGTSVDIDGAFYEELSTREMLSICRCAGCISALSLVQTASGAIVP